MNYYKVKNNDNIESVKHEIAHSIYIEDDIYLALTNSTNITNDFEKISKEEFEEVLSKTSIKTIRPYQPTNAEVAQMISDLQADLIIAGVI